MSPEAMALLRELYRTGRPQHVSGIMCRCRRAVVLGIPRVELAGDCPHHGARTAIWREVAGLAWVESG